MLVSLVKLLRVTALAVWIVVFALAVYDLTVAPATARADGGFCSEAGCESCNPCQFCSEQPTDPDRECWDKIAPS